MPIPRERLERLLTDGAEVWQRYERVREGRFHGFVPSDYALAYEELEPLHERADSFLELGSGAGVVTILADLLGFDAYGIEIEPWLVDAARELADMHDSGATFATGSFVPAGFSACAELTDSQFHVTADGVEGYTELGFDLDDFDLVYAFPWPGEEELFEAMVRECARPGAMLLTYGATEGFRLLDPR